MAPLSCITWHMVAHHLHRWGLWGKYLQASMWRAVRQFAGRHACMHHLGAGGRGGGAEGRYLENLCKPLIQAGIAIGFWELGLQAQGGQCCCSSACHVCARFAACLASQQAMHAHNCPGWHSIAHRRSWRAACMGSGQKVSWAARQAPMATKQQAGGALTPASRWWRCCVSQGTWCQAYRCSGCCPGAARTWSASWSMGSTSMPAMCDALARWARAQRGRSCDMPSPCEHPPPGV